MHPPKNELRLYALRLLLARSFKWCSSLLGIQTSEIPKPFHRDPPLVQPIKWTFESCWVDHWFLHPAKHERHVANSLDHSKYLQIKIN